MLYAYKEDGTKVRATKDTPKLPRGGYKSGCPLDEHPEMYIKHGGKHIMPHFAHYEGGEAMNYIEEDVKAHAAACDLIAEFLSVKDSDRELWIGTTHDDIVCPDMIYTKDGIKYAIEVQHSNLLLSEYMRRSLAYKKHGIIPIWIFHQNEDFTNPEFKQEYGIGSYAKGGKIKRTFRLTKKIERRTNRVQGRVLYYEFDHKSNILDPKLKLKSRNYKNFKNKKTVYIAQEEADIDVTNIENFEYLSGLITERMQKYYELLDSKDYTDHIHYKYAQNTWIPDTKVYFCQYFDEVTDGTTTTNIEIKAEGEKEETDDEKESDEEDEEENDFKRTETMKCGKELWYSANLDINPAEVFCEKHTEIMWKKELIAKGLTYVPYPKYKEHKHREETRRTD